MQAVRQFCKDIVSWEIETFPEHRAAIVAHFQPQTPDSRLVREAVERARADGAQRLRFVTARHLTSAIRLYDAMGFAPAEPWREIDPATAQQILFMQRAL